MHEVAVDNLDEPKCSIDISCYNIEVYTENITDRHNS